jgi:hypothetical protein
MQQAGQPARVPAQLEHRIATLSVLLETTRAIAAAAALYAALSSEQKHTADETVPVSPLAQEMVTAVPVLRTLVSVPTTAGTPNSRATMAA